MYSHYLDCTMRHQGRLISKSERGPFRRGGMARGGESPSPRPSSDGDGPSSDATTPCISPLEHYHPLPSVHGQFPSGTTTRSEHQRGGELSTGNSRWSIVCVASSAKAEATSMRSLQAEEDQGEYAAQGQSDPCRIHTAGLCCERGCETGC